MVKARSVSPWWAGKMIFALGLLVWFIASGIYGYWRIGSLYWLGRGMIFLGAAVNLYHIYRIKRVAGSVCQPKQLVSTGGLFPWIRHPMYLGELIVVLGFTLTINSPLAVIPFVFYYWFISLLCQDEDLNSAEDFPAEYAAWQARSKRLLPGVW